MAQALPEEAARPRSQWWRACGLLGLTLITTTSFGTGFYLATRTDVVTDLVVEPALLILGRPAEFFQSILAIPWTVFRTPELLRIGLMFSIPLLTILLAHELGHYIACRRHGIPCTLPYFLPAPLLIGTFGAFIRIRSRIDSRRQLLDVGAAGPIAGFIALLPFLIYGISKSRAASVLEVDIEVAGSWLFVPGTSLATKLLVFLQHGPLDQGMVLDLHPFALAAWVGLLVTSLNLLPAGQLDGGHILYAVSPLWFRRLRPILIAILLLLGFTWPGWWIWCGIVLFIARRHPPLVRPYEDLDSRRRVIALVSLLVLFGSFMVVPISMVAVLL